MACDFSVSDIFWLLPDAACVLGDEGIILTSNKLFQETIIASRNDKKCLHFGDLLHSEDIEVFQSSFSMALAGEVAKASSIRTLTCSGGDDLPVYQRYNWNLNGELGSTRIIVTGRIASENFEDEYMESELLDFFQRAPLGLHWLSGTGHILWANDTELEVLGYSAEEYIGQNILKVFILVCK